MNKLRLAILAAILATSTGCATLEMLWDKYVKPEIEKPDQPDAPAPQPGNDAVPFANLRWNRGGENFAGAVRDSRVEISGVNIRGTTLYYSGTGLSTWPVQSDNITHIWAIFFDDNRDGVFERGGKFDWGRNNAAPRPLHHVNRGYSNWDGYPANGTPWAAVITDKTGRHRSNIAAGVWPGGTQPAPVPAPVPVPPPSGGKQFSWTPVGDTVEIVIPDGINPWKFRVFAHQAREATSGKNIHSEQRAARSYTVPMSADAIRNAAMAKQKEAGKKQTGVVNVFVNTREVEIPASGQKYAGWEIPDPRKTYRGEGTRVLTPDGPNAPLEK